MMRRNVLHVLIGLSFGLSVFAYGGSTMQKYTDKDKGFTIMLPSDWEQKPDQMGAAIIALRPVSGPANQFRENINVVLEILDHKMTPKQYFDASQDVLKKVFNEYHLEKKGHTTIDKHDFYWSTFTHRLGNVRAKVVQYMTVDGTRAFVVTGSALPNTFPKYLSVFEAVTKTLAIQKRDVANLPGMPKR
jgi:hypothetical protein